MMANVILIIGRNPIVLANLASALEDEGFLVHTTAPVEQVSRRFNALEIDLVVFGRGVDPVTNARLRADFLSQNPGVLFVDGLAPVIPLLVKQIKQALVGGQTSERTISAFTCQKTQPLLIAVTVRIACQLTIDLYQLDAVHTTWQHTLISAYVMAGHHTFKIDRPYIGSSTIDFLAAGVDTGELVVLDL
jgi:hypothetical protein